MVGVIVDLTGCCGNSAFRGAPFEQPNSPCAVVCYLGPNVGLWRPPARTGERPGTTRTVRFWYGGGDEYRAVPRAGEQGRRLTSGVAEPKRAPTAQSGKPNENRGFTNSCGQPSLASNLRGGELESLISRSALGVTYSEGSPSECAAALDKCLRRPRPTVTATEVATSLLDAKVEGRRFAEWIEQEILLPSTGAKGRPAPTRHGETPLHGTPPGAMGRRIRGNAQD
jgi:hypothetical protein